MNKSFDISSDKDGKKSITLRESAIDDTSKTVIIKECENGYLITIERSYYEDTENGKNYKYETKSYISKDNPLESKEKEQTSLEVIDSVTNYMKKFLNKIVI